MKLIYFMLFWF